MGQHQTTVQLTEKRNIETNKKIFQTQCEGLMKECKLPFTNSINIQIYTKQQWYIEEGYVTLNSVIENRMKNQKYFTKEEILIIMETLIYTLGYLYDQGLIYNQINSQYIYYNQNCFKCKLLPNHLIPKIQNFQFKWGFAPESVNQKKYCEIVNFNDNSMNKINVFGIGALLMEICTLQPSIQCFNINNLEIFSSLICDRIVLIRERYSQTHAKIIANMLDYDAQERMDPKELSIWFNRQLRENYIQETISVSTMRVSRQKQYSIQKSQKTKKTGESNFYFLNERRFSLQNVFYPHQIKDQEKLRTHNPYLNSNSNLNAVRLDSSSSKKQKSQKIQKEHRMLQNTYEIVRRTIEQSSHEQITFAEQDKIDSAEEDKSDSIKQLSLNQHITSNRIIKHQLNTQCKDFLSKGDKYFKHQQILQQENTTPNTKRVHDDILKIKNQICRSKKILESFQSVSSFQAKNKLKQ